MESAETWFSSEVEKGILLSETDENGIVTRTYIAPLLGPEMVQNPDPLTLPKEYSTPYFCPHCGNGIGSSGAFTMHLRACQRRLTSVHHKGGLPAKLEQEPATRGHVKLSSNLPFQCIFCGKDFKVQLEDGRVRRRYACDECGQKVRAEEAERKKNPKVKRQALDCDRCGKQYKLEGFLVRHQMICEGFKVKRKREYEINEFKKLKCEEKEEVNEIQLKDEILKVFEIKPEDEIQKVFRIKLENKIYKTTEVKPEAENYDVSKIKSKNECHDKS